MNGEQPRPAVFFDRDGTLNVQLVREGKPFPPSTLADFKLYPQAAEVCRHLHAAGYRLVVVTNQPDVGRGTQSQAVVEAMHAELRRLIPEIARIEVCYAPADSPEESRRKPKPGMILDAARDLNLDLSRSWMVGDRWRDIDCGKRAGLKTVFIDFAYGEKLREQPDFRIHSLGELTQVILGSKHGNRS